MSYLEELLPEFRKGAKIRQPNWEPEDYIYLDNNGIVYDERNKPFDFTNEELFAEWEFYQEPIDWDYIIKNKCLCCFWDNFGIRCLGLLTDKKSNGFRRDNDVYYDNCRPARRDEVTFYEDKKDGD